MSFCSHDDGGDATARASGAAASSSRSSRDNQSVLDHDSAGEPQDETASDSSIRSTSQQDCNRRTNGTSNGSVDTSSSRTSSSTYCCEGRLASDIVRVTQAMLWWPLAILWLLLVVITGAIFFFFMVGAASRGDATKDEKWLNYSIQALNVLFTYAAVANQPRRLRDFVRLQRMPTTSIGVDWEGNVSNRIFDYVPYWHRMFVVVNLNFNCIFQFINQTFRIIYFSPELAAIYVIQVNLFFALSFGCAIVAPIHQYRMEQRVRREGKAPPGQELDPIQKFMGRADFSYRELGVESYQYAVHVLKEKRFAGRTKGGGDVQHDDKDGTAGATTDRTAATDEYYSECQTHPSRHLSILQQQQEQQHDLDSSFAPETSTRSLQESQPDLTIKSVRKESVLVSDDSALETESSKDCSSRTSLHKDGASAEQLTMAVNGSIHEQDSPA